jgi:hypothetical protein
MSGLFRNLLTKKPRGELQGVIRRFDGIKDVYSWRGSNG